MDKALQDLSRKTKDSHRSLLDNLAQQTTDRNEIRNQIIQGMMASQDTTSVLISNTVFLLSRDTSTWERLRAEAIAIGSTPLTAEGIRKSKLLHNVLYECKYQPSQT